MFKRLWHILFGDRYVALRRFRWFGAWFAWSPCIGLHLDLSFHFTPWHNADPEDLEDIPWNAEVKFDAAIGWIELGFAVPNDDHPDYDIPAPHCDCGRGLDIKIKRFCAGCGDPPGDCAALGCVADSVNDSRT